MMGIYPVDRDHIDIVVMNWCMDQHAAVKAISELKKNTSYLRPHWIATYVSENVLGGGKCSVYLLCRVMLKRGDVPMTNFLADVRELGKNLAFKIGNGISGCYGTPTDPEKVINIARFVYLRPIDDFDTDFFLRLCNTSSKAG